MLAAQNLMGDAMKLKMNAVFYLRIGQNIKLQCQVEGDEWEYCYWSHEGNGGCEWEWKHAHGGVRKQVSSDIISDYY